MNENQLTDLGSFASPKLFSIFATGNQLTTLGDVSGIRSVRALFLQDNHLTSLSGIEDLSLLNELVLRDNPISDLTPVAALSELKNLELSRTEVEDLSPLQSLEKLEQLNFRTTRVTTLRPLLGLGGRASNQCASLTVSQGLLDQDSTQTIVPTLCAAGWRTFGDYGRVFCDNLDCMAR